VDKLGDTLKVIKGAAIKHRSALVAFSVGKDSMTVLDLCSRVFDHIECVYMYFVPGLRFMEDRLMEAASRWHVKIHQYPHFHFYNTLCAGTYSMEWYKTGQLTRLTADDIYGSAIRDTGIPLIVTGMKKSDFLFRRLNLGRNQRNVSVIHPIQSWHTYDVLAYLKSHNIPIPKGTSAATNSIDLSPLNLLWLHDNYPDDFKKLLAYFPFAEAIVWRRKYFGNVHIKVKVKKTDIQDLRPAGWKH